jgi:hypothetical protein
MRVLKRFWRRLRLFKAQIDTCPLCDYQKGCDYKPEKHKGCVLRGFK